MSYRRNFCFIEKKISFIEEIFWICMFFIIYNIFPAIFWKIWLQMKEKIFAPKARRKFFGTSIWKKTFFTINIFIGGPNNTLAPLFFSWEALLPWKISLRNTYLFIPPKIFSCFIRNKRMGLFLILVSTYYKNYRAEGAKIFREQTSQNHFSNRFYSFLP